MYELEFYLKLIYFLLDIFYFLLDLYTVLSYSEEPLITATVSASAPVVSDFEFFLRSLIRFADFLFRIFFRRFAGLGSNFTGFFCLRPFPGTPPGGSATEEMQRQRWEKDIWQREAQRREDHLRTRRWFQEKRREAIRKREEEELRKNRAEEDALDWENEKRRMAEENDDRPSRDYVTRQLEKEARRKAEDEARRKAEDEVARKLEENPNYEDDLPPAQYGDEDYIVFGITAVGFAIWLWEFLFGSRNRLPFCSSFLSTLFLFSMRSSWKGCFYAPAVVRLHNRLTRDGLPPNFKWTYYNRSSTVPNSLRGSKFSLFLGKAFVTGKVRFEMVGHRFGEFFFTKRLGSRIHTAKKSQPSKAKAKARK